ncbi:MAG TPA: peptidylprolyl isomerase [Prolixibacteraceae bacterium]|nr:peptidylprolyl isomerase [Prolixibacteraceae bacterium]
MNKIIHIFAILLFFCMMNSCTKENKQTEAATDLQQTITETQEQESGIRFTSLAGSVFRIQTFDNDRILETGQGFAVTKNKIVAPFSLFREANRAVLSPLNGEPAFDVDQFCVYDRINNVIILWVDSLCATPLKLFGGKKIQGIKTTLIGQKQNKTLPLYSGTCLQEKTIQGQKLFSLSNVVMKSSEGAPVFVSNGSVLGMAQAIEVMYKKEYFAVPALILLDIIRKEGSPRSLTAIGNPNATRNARIKGVLLETDRGNITLKLYNETPAYRDNFIQLAEEGYFDGLLIHRVIRDFGIQSGAADTRYAAPDDIVGWKGPGYTLPAHFLTGVYHKRGAVGSPRKPDTENSKLRSDGSQFYIVTGRKYFDDELNEIEEKNGIRFTEEQRSQYRTLGGAPHLDGSYTVFGEVIDGLDVADGITLLPTKNDFRPLTDIRINKVTILE